MYHTDLKLNYFRRHVDVGLSEEESHNIKEDDKAVLLEGNVIKSTPSGPTISSTFSTIIRLSVFILSETKSHVILILFLRFY